MLAEGGEASYSIKKTRTMSLKQQLNGFYNGRMKSSDSLYFGESTEALEVAGVNGPLGMTQAAFKKSTKEKHNVPRRVFNTLSQNLRRPILAFYNDATAVFLIDDIDTDGKPVIVSVNKNRIMDRQHVAEITSVYGLDNPEAWIKNQGQREKKSFVVID